MTNSNNMNNLLRAVILGSIFAVISVFIFSLLMYFFDFPVSVQSGGLYILLNLSLFIASVHAGRRTTAKGYLYGLFSGLIFIVILLLINLLISEGTFSIMTFFLKMPVLLLVSLIGGIFGANLRK